MWIETERLILREFQLSDLQGLAPILANPLVMEFSPTGILSTQQTLEKIQNFMALYGEHGFGKWAVLLKANQKLIGYCGIAVEKIEDTYEIEIGYRLTPRYWGMGLATEAAEKAISYGFNTFQFSYILGIVERENLGSATVLQKLGMQFKKSTLFHGVPMDIYRLNALASN